jgi:hypothetical protein
MPRAMFFQIDERPPLRFVSKRPHVARQYDDMDDFEAKEIAAELTRGLRRPARHALLGRD